MRKLLIRLGVTLGIALLAIQVFRPARTNPEELPGQEIQSHVAWRPEVEGVWNRACSDCHSNRTVWPWYSNIAPASWFLTGHVNLARAHLNVSEWEAYQPMEQSAYLQKMCDYVRIGRMPLASYTWIHRDAILSAEEKEALCAWTGQAVERTQSADPGSETTPAGGSGGGEGGESEGR